MEQGKKLSLQAEMEREACEIEREIEKHPELEHFRISDKKEKELQERIREYEQNRRRRTSLRTPLRRRVWLAFVAVLILVFAMSITGVGSKSYLKKIWYRILDEESMQVVNVEDMNTKTSDYEEEATVYREIGKALKIVVVRLGMKPEEMYLKSYQIDEEQGRAHLFYEYQGEIIRYSVYLNDSDSSLGQKQEDKLAGSFIVTTDKQDITVRRYEVEGYDTYRYVADFHFHGADYQIKGILPEEEIKEIVENLNYFE